jgi:uncharacterized protein YkwD
MVRHIAAAALALSLISSAAIAGDLTALARDLERVLGKGSVAVSGSRRSAPPVRPDSTSALVDAMNRERAARGLAPLRLNRSLSLAAADRITDMFDQRYFAHVSPDGKQPWVWLSKHGYRYRTVGENLAVGYSSADRVVSGWMNSPGHRANILKGSFDEIGIAVANGAPVRGYAGPTVVAIYASR